MHNQSDYVKVLPVEGRRMLKRFIRLPGAIFATDPAWVSPLLFERRQHLSSANPYFEHARWRAWLAYRGSRPVGRISAQIDALYLDIHQDATGFFGFLDAENDPAVFAALFEAAEGWLRQQGMRRVVGPFSLSINDESGVLVAGFDKPPVFMMGHAWPYYGEQIEARGYARTQELLAYWIKDEDWDAAEILQTMRDRAGDRVSLRPLRRDRLDEELLLLRDIFNDAWSDNWGFVPFTEAEFRKMGRDMLRIAKKDFAQIAEIEGEAVGMIVALPNLNESIRDLNGRLMPFGWLKLLWRLKFHYPQTVRVALMGVRKSYQRKLLGSAVALLLIDALRAPMAQAGVHGAELGWVLESNARMWKMIEAVGGVRYKHYRLYEKSLV